MNVMVTGGSSGIGEALVRGLAKDGHQVCFTYCQQGSRAQSIAEETGTRAIHYDQRFPMLVGDLEQVLRDGQFDALVNNGMPWLKRETFFQLNVNRMAEEVSETIRAVATLSQAFAEAIRARQQPGAIVNVLTSYTLVLPPVQLCAYTTTKYALLGLTRSMAVELGRYKIRVNAVSPGMTRTPLLDDLPDRFIKLIEQQLPVGRLARPNEVASVIRFLISDNAKYLMGVNIPVSGGGSC